MQSVLHGDAEAAALAETNKRMVRLFTSSTFTDTKDWRDALMLDVFPVLKKMCQRLDLEFQVVDMRWGVRESTGNDHGTSGLCMWELEQCKRLSLGPAFVTFLGDRYGYRPFPSAIPEPELEALRAVLVRDDTRFNAEVLALIDKWFLLDSNRVPAEYILQPVSTFYPAFVDTKNREAQRAASAQWWRVFDQLQAGLRAAAAACTDEEALPLERRQLYTISVTNEEVMRGLLSNDDRNRQCFVYDRTFVGIDWQARNIKHGGPDDAQLRKFADWEAETGVFDAEAHRRQVVLKSEGIAQSGFDTANRLVKYEVDISDVAGANVGRFKNDFLHRIGGSILDAFEAAQVEAHAVFDEACAQLVAVRQKGGGYVGRPELRQRCAELCGTAAAGGGAEGGGGGGERGRGLVVVHGKSGAGKTTLMARSALDVMGRVRAGGGEGGEGVVVVRLLGTTPLSSRSRDAMASVLAQLSAVYDEDAEQDADADADAPRQRKRIRAAAEIDALDIGDLEKYFKDTITTVPREDKPLWLFLDSLDQLTDEDDGRKAGWLPLTWRNPSLCVVVSTLPDVGPTWGALAPAAAEPPPGKQPAARGECEYVEVAQLAEEDVDLILRSLQAPARRRFAPPHLQLLSSRCRAALSPLYLRLAFDTAASQWHSYSQPALEPSLSALIHALFGRLETRHGAVLVSHALGYVSCAAGAGGITSGELEDVLSCDDAVLEDVYQWWTPPVRRIPPLIWSRVRAELGAYLTDRGSGGALTHAWYHRQFALAAEDRFLYQPGHPRCDAPPPHPQAAAAERGALQETVFRFGSRWPQRHAMLARYYGGELDRGVVYKEALEDRSLVGMPLFLDGGGSGGGAAASRAPTSPQRVNSRRVAHQAFHQIRAGMAAEIDDATLGSFAFLRARVLVSGGLAELRRECGDAIAMLAELRRLERVQPDLGAVLGYSSANLEAVAALVGYINENLHLGVEARSSFDFACNALTWAADESLVYARAHAHLSREVRHRPPAADSSSSSSSSSSLLNAADPLGGQLAALPGWKKAGELRPTMTLPRAKGEVSAVAVSASQQLLAVCARHAAAVSLVDVRTGAGVATVATASGADASCVAFEGSARLAVAENNRITLWELDSSTSAGTLRGSLVGHRKVIMALSFQRRESLPAGDHPRLASGGLDQSVIVWDVEAQAALLSLQTAFVYSIQFHPLAPSLLLYANCGAGDVRILDIGEKKLAAAIDTTASEGRGCDTWSVAWNHDGTMAAMGRDYGVYLFDVVPAEAQEVAANATDAAPPTSSHTLLVRTKLNNQGAKAVAFDPAGQYLCAGEMRDMSVLIYEVLSGECVAKLVGHSNRVACIAVSTVVGQHGRSHSQFITGGDDAVVQVWSVPKITAAASGSGAAEADADKLAWHEQGVGRLEYNWDTRTIASCGADGAVKLWSEEWGLRATLRHEEAVHACALGPEGLVACATRTCVRLWRLRPPPSAAAAPGAGAGAAEGGASLLRALATPQGPGAAGRGRGYGGGRGAAKSAVALQFGGLAGGRQGQGRAVMLAMALADEIRILTAGDLGLWTVMATISSKSCVRMSFLADGALVGVESGFQGARKVFLVGAASLAEAAASAGQASAEATEAGSEGSLERPTLLPTLERAVGEGSTLDLWRDAIVVRPRRSGGGEQALEVYTDVVWWIRDGATEPAGAGSSSAEGGAGSPSTAKRVVLSHTGSPVHSVHFHPGGRFVATFSEGKDISVFSLADGLRVATVASLPGATSAALWTPHAFATVEATGVRLWANEKLLSPDVVASLPRPSGLKSEVHTVVFSASGCRFATADSHQVKIWDVGHASAGDGGSAPLPTTPKEILSFSFRGGGSGPGSIGKLFAFDAGDGGAGGDSENLFMAGGASEGVEVWDIARGCMVARLGGSRARGEGVLRGAFLSRTAIVLAVDALRCIFWDLPPADAPAAVEAAGVGELRAVEWSAGSAGLSDASLAQLGGLGLHPRGLLVSLGLRDGGIHVFAPPTGAHVCSVTCAPPTSILEMCFSDGSGAVLLAAAGGGGEVAVWRLVDDGDEGAAAQTKPVAVTTFAVACSTRGHESGVAMMAFAGTQLACSYFAQVRAIGVAVIDLEQSLSATGQEQLPGHRRLGVFEQEDRIPLCIALASHGMVVCGMRGEPKVGVLDFTSGASPLERAAPWIGGYPGAGYAEALYAALGARLVTRDALAVAETRSNGRRHTKDIRAVCWLAPSPTRPAARVATGSPDTTIKLWDALSGQLQGTLRGRKETDKEHEVLHLAAHEDGKSVAAASADGTVRIWDTESAREVRVLRVQGAESEVVCCAFGRGACAHLLAASGEAVELWAWRSGALLATLHRALHQPRHPMAALARCMFVAWAPPPAAAGRAQLLATAHLDGSIVLWSVRAQGGEGGVEAEERGVLRGPPRGLHCLSFNHDGSRLASAAADGGLRVWDPARAERAGVSNVGGLAPQLPRYDTMPGLLHEFKAAHAGHVACCMFHPRPDRGHLVVSGGQDSAVCVFDTVTRTRIAVLQGHTNAVYNTTFSPDGEMLATSSQDESAIVWAPVPTALSLASTAFSTADGSLTA